MRGQFTLASPRPPPLPRPPRPSRFPEERPVDLPSSRAFFIFNARTSAVNAVIFVFAFASSEDKVAFVVVSVATAVRSETVAAARLASTSLAIAVFAPPYPKFSVSFDCRSFPCTKLQNQFEIVARFYILYFEFSKS